MTAFAWIIALVALAVATGAVIFARRAAAVPQQVEPAEAAPTGVPHDEARLSAVFAALPVASLRVDADAVINAVNPAALANFSAQPVASEDIAVDVELIPCTSAQFRSAETQLCTPCTPCAPGQAELRPCLPFSDRLCNNSLLIELAILGAAGVLFGTSSAFIGSLEALTTAIRFRVTRASGLGDRLWSAPS